MIQVTNLSKSFNTIKAVDGINFTIKKGEIYGLLGPNGAGKSTTINMLSAILPFDAGSISINGLDLKSNISLCKQIIGIVPQEISLYEELSAYDNLLFWGNLYNIPSKELNFRVENILKVIGLSERKRDQIKTYSGGMKRRINIAAALLHEPEVLFLDEPTVGIDPQSRNYIFELIETLNRQGMTIIYTTHYMEEVERLCNRIAIMDSGKIIAQGTKKELRKLIDSQESVSLEFNALTKNDIDCFKKKLKCQVIQKDNTLTFQSDVKSIQDIIAITNDLNLEVKDLELKKINLESVFLSLTGKQLRD